MQTISGSLKKKVNLPEDSLGGRRRNLLTEKKKKGGKGRSCRGENKGGTELKAKGFFGGGRKIGG